MDRKRDGHIHSHFCPHGSKDGFEEYIKQAIEKGFREITFAEHMPLPSLPIEKKLIEESSPNMKNMESYFKEAIFYKEKYKELIKINVGVEVDYIEGFEEEITEILNQYGRKIEDSILSIHFLKVNDKYYSLDYSPETFNEIVEECGSLEEVYNLYYETLIKLIEADLGVYKPRRIGHCTLIRIFNKVYPLEYKNNKLIDRFLFLVKERGYELDYNTAGLRKDKCLEAYPSGYLLERAKELKINFVMGSDSHSACDIGRNF